MEHSLVNDSANRYECKYFIARNQGRGIVVKFFTSKEKRMQAFDDHINDLVVFGDLMDLPHHYGGLTQQQAKQVEDFARGGGSRQAAILKVRALIEENVRSRRAAGELMGASRTLGNVDKGADVWHNLYGKGWVVGVAHEEGEVSAVVDFKMAGIQNISLPSKEMEIWRD